MLTRVFACGAMGAAAVLCGGLAAAQEKSKTHAYEQPLPPGAEKQQQDSALPPTQTGIESQPCPDSFPAPLTQQSGCGGACGCGEGCVDPRRRPTCCDGQGCGGLFSEKPILAGLRNRKAGDLTYSAGVGIRHRFMHEENRIRPGGIGQTNYDLWRIVPFIDAKYRDTVGVHVEAIDASAFGYDAPFFPVIIDENRSDLLQAYIDLTVADSDDGKLTVRYGRQFLKYGSQHLVSPLAWANTFRNFEGYKVMYSSGDWAIDGFAVQPVNAPARNRFQPRSFDNPNNNIWFGGSYATYKGWKNRTVDLYWLWFKESQTAVRLLGGDRHTIGARYAGTCPTKQCGNVVRTWDWDLEAAWQFGEDSFLTGPNQDVSAGFVSFIGGHTWNSVIWSPSIKGIFYWGSGDDDPTDGDQNTMYTLFPLGHAYWGILDNLSGQNMFDYGVRGSVKPHKKLTLSADWHWFDLASDNDFLYNIAGVPFALAPNERHIGEEIDIVGTVTVSPSMNVQVGYSRFLYGAAVSRSAFTRPDADQFYVQTTLTF